MDVVGHQHVGVKRTAELVGKLLEVMQVELLVVFGMKADRTIVASLNDVPRNTGKRQTGAARHGGGLGE